MGKGAGRGAGTGNMHGQPVVWKIGNQNGSLGLSSGSGRHTVEW